MKKFLTALVLGLLLCLAAAGTALAAEMQTVSIEVKGLQPGGYYMGAVWDGSTLLTLFDAKADADGTLKRTVEIGDVPLETGTVKVAISSANAGGTDPVVLENVPVSKAPGGIDPPVPAAYALTVQGGTLAGGAASGRYAAGVSVSIQANTPETGKVFDRWTSTGGSFADAAAASTTFTMPGEDVTVTAVYKDTPGGSTETPDPPAPPAVCTVTFHANGGTLASGTQTRTTGQDGRLSALPASPSRSGYQFTGWFTAASGGTKIDVSHVFTADTTLYAHWEKDEEEPDTYSIHLISASRGSVFVSTTRAAAGERVRVYVYPDSGYYLDTLWVTDRRGRDVSLSSDGRNRWTFRMPSSWVDVQAVFVRSGSAWSGGSGSGTQSAAAPAAPQITIQPVPRANVSGQTFYDVPASHWAAGEIAWAAQRGYLNGTGGGAFSPDGRMNYQQLWMVIARMLGSAPANVSEANLWAVKNGFSGGGAPASPVSRQDLVRALYRAAFLTGGTTAASPDALSRFPDRARISAGARDAVAWAVTNGILGGNASGRLNPEGQVTRAQFAVMLYRYSRQVRYTYY